MRPIHAEEEEANEEDSREREEAEDAVLEEAGAEKEDNVEEIMEGGAEKEVEDNGEYRQPVRHYEPPKAGWPDVDCGVYSPTTTG